MAKWQASGEWEYNGYDDSDFYVVVYDDETDQLERIQVGSTRYGGCSEHGSQCCYRCSGITVGQPIPEETKTRMVACVRRTWIERLIASELWKINNPEKSCVGQRIITTKDAHNRPRSEQQETCYKCDGSGKWANPNNSNDVRRCFRCHGTGKVSVRKAGKGSMVKIPAGTKGQVKQVFERRSQYGTWSYGITALVQADDGTEFRIQVDSLKLDREVDVKKIEETVALRASQNCLDPYQMFATAFLRL